MRVRDGDRHAYGELVSRYVERSYWLAYRVLRHREDAEDLVQDAFLAALQHIDAFDVNRPFWPWLSRIIMNRGLDIASSRSVRATEPLPDEASYAGATPAETTERAEILARFRHSLALLPPRQQAVIQLFELDGYSIAEIADLFGSSTSTVRWHLHMARHQLRDAMAPLREGGA